MTDEQEALAWFEQFIPRLGYALNPSEKHALTLKRMLARTLPEEPTHEMISALVKAGVPDPQWAHVFFRALRAELTKPATREVEVWRVEYAKPGMEPGKWLCLNKTYRCEVDARTGALPGNGLASDARCIRVTGPHKQEVPA